MVVLHYLKAPPDVRSKTVPELVKKVGALRYGLAWEDSNTWKYFPSFVAKDSDGKKRRWQRVLSFDGMKYSLKRKRLSVPPEFRQLVSTFSREYVAVCNEIRIAIFEGKLKGTIGQLGLTQLPLSNFPRVVTSQRNTVFCTGYLGIGLASTREYGIIEIEPKSEKEFLSGITKSLAPPQKIANLSDKQKDNCRAFVTVMMREIVDDFGEEVDEWPLFKVDEPLRILSNVINGFIGSQNQNGQDRLVKILSHPPAAGYKSSGVTHSGATVKKLAKEIFNPQVVARRGHVNAEGKRRIRALEFLKRFEI